MEEINKENKQQNMSENKDTTIELPLEENDQTIQELKVVKEKLATLENQYLRLMADYQNLQKRTGQEKEELYKFAAGKTIEVLLPALDTFDYAKSTVKADSTPQKIIEDFSLVFEMLLKCLKDVGLETIDQTGVPFNPFQHEPLHQIPTNDLPDQTIVQVLKKGYLLNNKVIRPALVSVSVKGSENK